MKIENRVGKILNFSLLSWIRDTTLLKYGLMIFITLFIITIIQTRITSSFFGKFSSPTINQTIVFEEAMQMIFVSIGLTTPLILIMTIIGYLIYIKGLKLINKNATYSIINFIKFLIIPFMEGIFALFSLYNLKFLLVGITGLILIPLGIGISFIASGIGLILITIGIILAFIYFFIIIHNMIRLSLSTPILVETGEIFNSLKKSWIITEGNVIGIFVIGLVFGIIIMLISAIVSIPTTIYLIVTSFDQMAQFTAMQDPIYYIIIIPSYLFYAYISIASILLPFGIYKQLITNSRE